jgi:tight adherence protein B
VRRLSAALAGLLLAVAPAWTAAAQTSAEPDIRQINVDAFPKVAVTVSLPGQTSLTKADVSLSENGKKVGDVSVEPLEESAAGVDVVLALDLSASMRGDPLASALDAARTFVAQLPSEVSVGLVTFNDSTSVVQPITPDRDAVLSALEGISETRPGTALFEAVTDASGLFSGEGQRNIVLLANGPNNVGDLALDDAVASAKAAGANILGVGFRGGETDVSTMRRLAEGTDGSYQAAETAGLEDLYAAIATGIADQYLVSYTSSAELGSELEITVRAGNVEVSRLALAPKETGPGPEDLPPPVVPEEDRFFASPLGLILAGLLTGVAVFTLAWMSLGAASRIRRDREAAARMTAVARPQQETASASDTRVAWIPQSMLQVAGRVVEAGGFGGKLDHQLEQAGLPVRAGEFVVATVLAAIAGAFVGLVLFRNIVFVLLIAAVGGLVPYAFLKYALSRRARKLEEQLPDVLSILASSLRAGYSFLQALDTVAKEIPEPGASEFNRAVAEIRLGRPVDEAMNAMAARVGSEDLHWAVMAVNIQREVGGNLAEILDTVSDTVRERQAIRREVRVLTTEGRLSMYVLIGLPILFGLYLFAVKREYLSLLVTTTPGIVMLVTAISLLVLGYFWIRKIVRIDV